MALLICQNHSVRDYRACAKLLFKKLYFSVAKMTAHPVVLGWPIHPGGHEPMDMIFLNAFLNSGLKMVYMTGLTKEFM